MVRFDDPNEKVLIGNWTICSPVDQNTAPPDVMLFKEG